MTHEEKFRRMLGHKHLNYLNRMYQEKSVKVMPYNFKNVIIKFWTCIQNKMHNLLFQNNCTGANEILKIVYTDLSGPRKTEGFDG